MRAAESSRAAAAAMAIASSLGLTARVAPAAEQVAQFEVDLAQRLARAG
ncbi:hypothetical protein [Nocardiopsis sp. CC223A]|nr:hypothetical protein [Nocardiopsis sp. CC223A]